MKKLKVEEPIILSNKQQQHLNLTTTLDIDGEECSVGDIFDFLDNQIYAIFRRRRFSSSFEPFHKAEKYRSSYDNSNVEETIVPVRNLQFIPKASIREEVAPVHFPENRRSCCECMLT
mmetsp:Transcript_11240/g.22123  ORF Transcript_11240/g.22123 Transcript_11240/m.22123 type:complete len:118 (+) Transcript_11240:1744-2097(+)